jgi:hypothetical protein
MPRCSVGHMVRIAVALTHRSGEAGAARSLSAVHCRLMPGNRAQSNNERRVAGRDPFISSLILFFVNWTSHIEVNRTMKPSRTSPGRSLRRGLFFEGSTLGSCAHGFPTGLSGWVVLTCSCPSAMTTPPGGRFRHSRSLSALDFSPSECGEQDQGGNKPFPPFRSLKRWGGALCGFFFRQSWC